MLKLLNVLELMGLFGSFWDCIGLLLVCFGLCCAALWCECVDSCGVLWECFGLYRVCFGSVWDCRSIMKIAKIIKSVMAITELKKIAKKRCKLLKLLELLGLALVSFGYCFGISWLLLGKV